jgi:hypothetical protein
LRADEDPFCRRQRTPLLLVTFLAGGSLFVGFKWRAVMARSEAAKRANARPGDNDKAVKYFGVEAGRSGGGI